ncbi:MAG: hypothetical protein HKP58_19070, partial [Desulfatitalea sp.]|nr:hypothetical protein [Desulfatitalea sp.]NNK02518.1 hypothetical protein [Desulfatitalea sp.]
MIRILCAALIVTTLGFAAYGALTLYDETLQVGRMWETPAVRPHEKPIPVMADESMPYTGGERLYR